jgi:hypothetical protein
VIPFAAVAEAAPDNEEESDPTKPRFLSPDGAFGLLVTKDATGDSPSDRVDLIELATRRSLAMLSDPEAPEISSKARLEWSADSKRVAAYTATRVDGFTRLFVRDGAGFTEVKLPKFPDLPNPEQPSAEFRRKHKFKFLKWIDTGTIEFVRWLKNGDVEMRYHNEVATQEGRGFRAEINATIAIDEKHHATLKKVVRQESMQ